MPSSIPDHPGNVPWPDEAGHGTRHQEMDYDGYSLMIQVVVSVLIFALFRWAKKLRDES